MSQSSAPFQLMPELPTWEFDSLKESILRHGILVPVFKDEDGTVIDGHHRLRIADELGIRNVPTITIAGLTDEQKRDHAILLNLVRRKITRKQLRKIIETELRRTPDISNRWLAEMVASTKNTVESVRKDLLSRGEIDHVDSYRGKDGKSYSVTKIYTEKRRQTESAKEALATLGDDAPKKAVSLKQLKREAKKKLRTQQRRDRYRKPSDKAPIRLYHSDFRDLEEIARIDEGSVDLLFTDVPYNKNFTKQFEELGAFARRVLKDGGVFCVYVVVVQVAEAITAFTKNLDYQATAFSSWLGDGSIIQSLQCVTQSTPVLVFSKGKWTRTTSWYNVFHNAEADQDLHVWQKPIPDVEHWIQSFSDPGDLVCDCLAGSGTTALACRNTDRMFVGGDIDRDAIRLAQTRMKGQAKKSSSSPSVGMNRKPTVSAK